MTVPYFAFGAIGLTGGEAGKLDSISPSYLSENDMAFAVENNKVYFYRMDIDSGEDSNPPYIIKPAAATDDRRWVLISQETYTTNIIQQLGGYVQTSEIKAIDEETLTITTGDGEEIKIHSDGKVEFPSTVQGLDPVNDTDFVTKQYLINTLANSGEGGSGNYIFTFVINIVNWQLDGSLYYFEITHGKDTVELIITCWWEGQIIYPEMVEIIDNNTIKIWMTDNTKKLSISIL